MIGHNHIASYVDRILKLEEERAAFTEDIKEVYLEAKNNGIEIKGLRAVVTVVKKGKEAFKEEEALKDAYLQAYFGDLL